MISLSGQGAGLSAPLYGNFRASTVRKRLAEFQAVHKTGGAQRSMIGRILQERPSLLPWAGLGRPAGRSAAVACDAAGV